jgi:hypothetical protein
MLPSIACENVGGRRQQRNSRFVNIFSYRVIKITCSSFEVVL